MIYLIFVIFALENARLRLDQQKEPRWHFAKMFEILEHVLDPKLASKFVLTFGGMITSLLIFTAFEIFFRYRKKEQCTWKFKNLSAYIWNFIGLWVKKTHVQKKSGVEKFFAYFASSGGSYKGWIKIQIIGFRIASLTQKGGPLSALFLPTRKQYHWIWVWRSSLVKIVSKKQTLIWSASRISRPFGIVSCTVISRQHSGLRVGGKKSVTTLE